MIRYECYIILFFFFSLHLFTIIHLQSFLKHKDAKPLRDVLASNPNRFVPLLVPAGPAATVRPGSPSTSTARLDLQFQAIKVGHTLLTESFTVRFDVMCSFVEPEY